MMTIVKREGYRWPWLLLYGDGRYRSFEFKSEAEDWKAYEEGLAECEIAEDWRGDADPGL